MNLGQFFSVLSLAADAPGSVEGVLLKQTLPLSKPLARLPFASVEAQVAEGGSGQFSKEQLQALRDFAHDMRTPLASILTLCEQMKQGTEGDAASAERTINHARLLMRMMDGFIAQSRAEGGTLVKAERLMLDLIDESVDQVRDLAVQRGVSIRIAPTKNCYFVTVASDVMVRALNNLLVNAVKYGEPGSAIDIDLQPARHPAGASVVMELSNRIASQPASAQVVTKSCGLGLDFVRKVLAMHGGQFELDLQSQGVAIARLSLPCDIEPI